jgi:hypothetical protein
MNRLQNVEPVAASTTLTLLLKNCQKLHAEYPEWRHLNNDVESCMNICITLLEFYESELRPIWHQIGSEVYRDSRALVIKQCQNLLSNISAGMLLEVRFITASSQRILDSFCLVYYAALSISHMLDVEELIACFNSGNPSVSAALTFEQPENSPTTDEEAATNTFETLQIIDKPTTSCSMPKHRQAAIQIYEAIAILFNLPLPEKDDAFFIPTFNPQLLRSLTLVFPPPGINSETLELLNAIPFVDLDRNDVFYVPLNNWVKWFRVTVRWHK